MIFSITCSAEAGAWQASREEARRHRQASLLSDWVETDDLASVLRLRKALAGQGEEMDRLLGDRLQSDIKACRRSRRWGWLMLSGAAALLSLMADRGVFHYGASASASYLIVPLWLASPFLMGWYDAHSCCKRRMRNLVTLLYKRRAMQAVNPLIEAMTFADGETRAMAAGALTVLLPGLEDGDVRMLSARHRACLHRALHGCNSYLILAILSVLEKDGDVSALPHVQRLTTCSAWIAKSSLIRKQARACVVLLRRRAAEQVTAQTLLRATTPNTGSAAVLLRGADASGIANSQEMLRASLQEVCSE